MAEWMRLTYEERLELNRGLNAGQSLRAIATAMGRQPSTLSREVKRNSDGQGRYNPALAQRDAKERAKRPKPRLLERKENLARWIADRLQHRWSPQQIAGRLRKDHPDDPTWWVSAETIYQSIYVQGRGGLSDELSHYLRTRRTRRRSPQTNKGHGQLNDTVNIAERPPDVDERRVPGHWEGDLLLGGKQSQIATLVERVSRYVILVHLPTDRTAPTVAAALARAVEGLPAHLMRSITWDQGKEMARHVDFTVATGVQVYFCDPGKPWQRGSNENTNRLLRDYFPKGQTDFRTITAEQLQAVAHELNNRPRKTLGYRTPAEVYAQHVALAP